ncbi:hypothetical protein VDF90_07895 [Xanthomonas campestris pv. raphani]|uniref:hypothetical protein n=1 Tax=Xanthomonas campestris TaxID=339 RepID=UPI002ADE9832|nr:hypothetical protein [Xanthomonas campestris]MEA0736326.1 hypothetical protein [Xanthomonas campestris pv. campestris]MEA9787169.1 hypothetical protein [Xanthomonas campestris pv. raphani]
MIARIRRLVIYARALPVHARDAPGSRRWWMPPGTAAPPMHKTVLDVFVVGIVLKHQAHATTMHR